MFWLTRHRLEDIHLRHFSKVPMTEVSWSSQLILPSLEVPTAWLAALDILDPV